MVRTWAWCSAVGAPIAELACLPVAADFPKRFSGRSVEIGDAEFKVETLKARFADGHLFADGTWTAPDGRGILRAADLFSAVEDGRITSLTVVWTNATSV